jgi:hypothetical protein
MVVAALIVGALVAVATGEDMQQQAQTWALTTIDHLPTKGQLDTVLTDPMHVKTPTELLVDYATTSDNIGIRLRAITALSSYFVSCADSDPVHSTLTQLIADNASAHSGANLLILRAAVEADGPLRCQVKDRPSLEALLNHPSRDIRAAAAHALAALCDTNAADALSQRYQIESTDQVKLAISEALRILSQPLACP